MHLCRIRAGCLNWQDAVHRACLSLFIVLIILVMYRHFWQGKQDYSLLHFAFNLNPSSTNILQIDMTSTNVTRYSLVADGSTNPTPIIQLKEIQTGSLQVV